MDNVIDERSAEDMTDDVLIGYCHAHCQTPRALFHESHINRLLELAGMSKKAFFEWASYGPEIIDPIVKEARVRQKRHKAVKEDKAPWQEVGF